MKIALINLPIRTDLPPNTPNLGLAYVAASLRNKGHEITVIDANAYRLSLDATMDACVGMAGLGVELFGVSAMLPQFKAAKAFLLAARENGLKTVLGGSLATSCPELMNKYATYVFCGEGEYFDADFNYYGPSGILKVYPEHLRATNINLDDLLPALDLFPMDVYLNNPVGGAVNRDKWTSGVGTGERSMLILSSRGCAHKCIYCHHDFLGAGVRFRSADSLVREIQHWQQKYEITNFSFADDNFTANKARLLEFCDQYQHNANWGTLKMIPWGCAARLDACTTENLFAMKKAGCVHIGFGLESGSPKMLKNMKKGITIETCLTGIQNIQAVGLDYDYTLVLGLPGEDANTVQETIDFCKANLKPPENIFFATAYPGTELWDWCDGPIMKDSWIEKYLEALGENDERCLINYSHFGDDYLMSAMEHMRRELGVKDRPARKPERVIL